MAKKNPEISKQFLDAVAKAGDLKLTLTVPAKQRGYFTAYGAFIEEKIKAGERIPNHVLKTFMSFIQSDKHNQKVLRENDIIDAINSGILKMNKYISFEGYKIHTIQEPNSEIITKYRVPYSNTTLIKHVVPDIFKTGYNRAKTKNEIFDKCRELIDAYCLENLNAKHQKFLTNYKRDIISAKIIEAIGYKVITGEKNNNHAYSQVRRRPPKRKRIKP